MKNSTPVIIPTTTACSTENLSGKAPLFRATAKRFALVVLSALSLGLLATACKSNDSQPKPTPDGQQVSIDLSLEAAPLTASGASGTKAATDLSLPAEQRIYNLWIVQFNNSGVLVGTPSYETIPTAQQTGANVKLSATVTTGTDQTFYFIANTNSSSLLNTTNCATVTTLNAVAMTIAEEFKPNATYIGIPMLGVQSGLAVTAGQPLTGITVDRLVAKIQLRYKNDFSGFTPTKVQLKNVPKNMFFQAQPALSSNNPSAASGFFDCIIEDPATAGTDAGYSTFTYYIPENLRAPKSGTTAALPVIDRILANTDDQMATYIEICGTTADDQFVTYSILPGEVPVGAGGNDFNLKRNVIYTVTFDITNANPFDPRVITTNTTSILPAQTANTYMITPGTGVSLPAKIKGNEATNTLATQSVGLLWQDISGLVRSITYNSSTGKMLVITDGTKGSGNALAAAYDGPNGTGNILWSWHIWVTDYKPSEAGVAVRTANTSYAVTGGQVHTYGTQFQTANGTSRTIMDRNLGATIGYNTTVPTTATEATGTYGMAYEWGRKDPFPPAITTGTTTGPSIPLYNASGVVIPAASAPTIVDVGGTPGGTTVANSILNPTTFYYNTITTSTFDWADPQDATLWLPTSKTLYDPCPKGWRVPPQNTWMDFTRTSATVGTFLWYNSGVLNTSTETLGSQNGRRYTAGTVNAWYPASGFRDWNGMVAAGQTNGQWASSTTTTGTSHYLYFAPSFLWTDSFCTRSSGLSVRCVQE